MCGPYTITFDRTGFPLIQRQNWSFAIALFPVSKYQFERFLAVAKPIGNLYTDPWYREILRRNPRRSWRNLKEHPWEHFLTGLDESALKPFLSFLGPDYRLPRREEWLKLLQAAPELASLRGELAAACQDQAAPPVSLWIKGGMFPLVLEGVLEMVQDQGNILYLGRPFPGLFPNTWDPARVRTVDWVLAQKIVGFRVAYSPAKR